MASKNPPACAICDHHKISKLAVIWCNQCNEGLCDECRNHHRISKSSKNHDTITIENYLHLPPDVANIEQSCEKHDESFITFCRIHDCPCCKICMIQDHKKWDALADISDVIENVKSSALFQEVERNLNYVSKTLEKILTEKNRNVQEIKQKRKKIEQEIGNLRKDLQSFLDKLHGKLLRDLIDTEQKAIKELKKQVTNLESDRKDIIREQENFDKITNHASELQAFLYVKKMEDRVSTKTKFLGSLKQQNVLDQVSISVNVEQTLKDLRKNISSFGKIQVKKEKTEVSFEPVLQAQILAPLPKRNTSFEHVNLSCDKTIDIKRTMVSGCTIISDDRIGIRCRNVEFESEWRSSIVL